MRLLLASIGAATFCGCSLIVSTSGLTGEPPPQAPDAADAAAPVVEAAADADAPEVDAGVDAPPRDPSIIGEWHFDDTSDASGKGNDAVLSGDAVFTADGVRGKCITLAGTGRIRMSTLWGAGFPTNGTLSFYMKYTFSLTDPTDRTLVDSWDGTRAHLFVRRPPNATGQEFQAALQPPNTSYAWATNFDVAPGAWTHVVLVWRSGDTTTGEGGLYVGKKLVKRTTIDGPFVPTSQQFDLGNRFIGAIDEVVLYDRALSDAEALALD